MLNIDLIDEMLEDKYWKYSDLAKAIEIPRQQLSHIKVSRTCSLSTLIKIAHVLNCTLDELVITEGGEA